MFGVIVIPVAELFREYGAGELNPRDRVGDIMGISWSRTVKTSFKVRCTSSAAGPTRRKRIFVCCENARDISESLRGSVNSEPAF